MAISKDKLHELVELFYQPTSKTFYINSTDGKTFIKPIGVFVSLGITTSMKVLEEIKNTISEYNYDVVIAEISSKKVGGQYLNTLKNTANPKQYQITEFGNDIMDEEMARKELAELHEKINLDEDLQVLHQFAPKLSKLKDLINKLTENNGWDSHRIQKENDDYKIFHQLVNYEKRDGIEYRIGLYVTEKA